MLERRVVDTSEPPCKRPDPTSTVPFPPCRELWLERAQWLCWLSCRRDERGKESVPFVRCAPMREVAGREIKFDGACPCPMAISLLFWRCGMGQATPGLTQFRSSRNPPKRRMPLHLPPATASSGGIGGFHAHDEKLPLPHSQVLYDNGAVQQRGCSAEGWDPYQGNRAMVQMVSSSCAFLVLNLIPDRAK